MMMRAAMRHAAPSAAATAARPRAQFAAAARRWISTSESALGGLAEPQREGYRSLVHFRLTQNRHPLGVEKKTWKNPTQNHVWNDEEIEQRFGDGAEQPHYTPRTFLDKLIYRTVRFCYHAFNFATGYKREDPSPKAVAYRVLILESVAGVPGMVAAMSRHFRSLKAMERDNGWIHTLLEEAENERMHLLVFMKMFKPSLATRFAVVAAQYVLAPTLLAVYAVHPPAMHRFVGYLEETAVATYGDVLKWMRTPGSQLNKAWMDLPAPAIAKGYWCLAQDASFYNVIEQIAADETHHRDVNHTFASMKRDETNPYVTSHNEDTKAAFERLVGVRAKDTSDDGLIDTIEVDTSGDGRPDMVLRDTTGDNQLDTVVVEGTAIPIERIRLLVKDYSGQALGVQPVMAARSA